MFLGGGLLTVVVLNVAYDYFVGYKIFGVMYAEYFYDNLFMIAEVLLLLAFFSTLRISSEKMKLLIRHISPMTMGVYIIHLVLYRMIKLYYSFEMGWVNILICFVTFFISVLATAVIKRIPLVHNLVEL